MDKVDQFLLEQKVRQWVCRILRDDNTGSNSLHESLYGSSGDAEVFKKVMIEPFTRIFKRGRQGLKRVLTNAVFSWDMLTTIDPIKKRTMRRNWEARKKEMTAQQKELMKGVWEPLNSPDIELAAFLFNPALYLSTAAPRAALKNRQGISDWFREVGIGDPSVREKTRTKDDDVSIREPKGVIGVTFDALKKLFFIEASIMSDELLREQVRDTTLEKGTPEQLMSSELADSGVLGDISSAARSQIDKTTLSVDELVSLYKPSIDALKQIENASTSGDIDAFLKALSSAEGAGLQIGGASPAKIRQTFNNDISDILNDQGQRDEFIVSMLSRDGKDVDLNDVPSVPDNELRNEIATSLLGDASDGMRDSIAKSIDEMKASMLRDLDSLGRPPSSMESIINKSEMGREYLGIFTDALKSLGI